VECADRVESGLEKIKSGRFDLLITDLRLPDGMGTAVIRAFKQAHPQGRVIVISGSLNADKMLSEAPAVDIDRCLLKPFRLDELKEAVQTALS
jgi:two-component system response regulator PilR (NtrC family)